MVKLKAGDRVKRVKQDTITPYRGMKIGDEDIVVKVNPFEIELRHFGKGHSPSAFQVVPNVMENE